MERIGEEKAATAAVLVVLEVEAAAKEDATAVKEATLETFRGDVRAFFGVGVTVTLRRFFFGEDVKAIVARERGERRKGGVMVVVFLFLLEGGF